MKAITAAAATLYGSLEAVAHALAAYRSLCEQSGGETGVTLFIGLVGITAGIGAAAALTTTVYQAVKFDN